MAGYSGTPLIKKLGIKAGNKIKVINAPENYFNLIGDLPEDVMTDKRGVQNLIHVFAKGQSEIEKALVKYKKEIVQDGMIWISWPKKSSGIVTDITEDTIRNAGLAIGLVDVKVCAIDDIWSGLKFVIPLKDRIK
ncbi:MAG: DUF3052 family protein [Bacteroidetes bacterium]|nr:DUF3052 family protein [Bacteroidota bacterium]